MGLDFCTGLLEEFLQGMPFWKSLHPGPPDARALQYLDFWLGLFVGQVKLDLLVNAASKKNTKVIDQNISHANEADPIP